MKKAIVFQMIIFVAAYFTMTPDTLEDNTHLFGLFGDVEVIKGNVHWVLLGAAVLSIINLWVWWPKEVKKNVTSSEAPIAAEAKEIDRDPKTPVID